MHRTMHILDVISSVSRSSKCTKIIGCLLLRPLPLGGGDGMEGKEERREGRQNDLCPLARETLAPPLRRPTTNECIQYELLDLSVSRLHNKFIISVQSVYTSIGLDLALFDRKSRQCRAYINTGQSAEIFSSLNISCLLYTSPSPRD